MEYNDYWCAESNKRGPKYLGCKWDQERCKELLSTDEWRGIQCKQFQTVWIEPISSNDYHVRPSKADCSGACYALSGSPNS